MIDDRPVVLSFSGHDPSGGAGIQADIETLTRHRCHSVSVITALTEQNTSNIKKLLPQSPENIIRQARTLLDDLPVKVFKIGLIGHHETAEAIYSILEQFPNLPVIFDPVLAAGGGAALSDDRLLTAIIDLLLPCTTILTPNSQEARKLAGLADLQDCGLELLAKGCAYVLITGTHESTPTVSHQLFHDHSLYEVYSWPRLTGSYHGSGCTLASAIAAFMAHGVNPVQAAAKAQRYTWHSLQAGYRPGQGQYIPDRFYPIANGAPDFCENDVEGSQ